jgi:hypothetical protein
MEHLPGKTTGLLAELAQERGHLRLNGKAKGTPQAFRSSYTLPCTEAIGHGDPGFDVYSLGFSLALVPPLFFYSHFSLWNGNVYSMPSYIGSM